MGLRASQLRNRQQVQDLSAPNAVDEVDSAYLKRQISYPSNGVINNNNNNNNNDVDADVENIKDSLRNFGDQEVRENSVTENKSNSLERHQQVNGNSRSQPSKVSTLQRQTSHIQSLAQRIRRSSSLRAPKLRALIPSFVTGKRKVSLGEFACSIEICFPQSQASMSSQTLVYLYGVSLTLCAEIINIHACLVFMSSL